MLRLESLEYPAFFQGSGGGGIGFQPVVVNPEKRTNINIFKWAMG